LRCPNPQGTIVKVPKENMEKKDIKCLKMQTMVLEPGPERVLNTDLWLEADIYLQYKSLNLYLNKFLVFFSSGVVVWGSIHIRPQWGRLLERRHIVSSLIHSYHDLVR
jgi:hypothetical protein